MKHLVIKLLIVVVFNTCFGISAKANLTGQINSIISRSSQKDVQFSILILKADTGEVVYGHETTRAMTPASNMKIIVTAAALKYLGPRYEYKTKIGLCDNDLVIIGSGDPLLGDEVTDMKYGRGKNWILDDITAVLKRNNIKGIDDIIVDSNIFDDQLVHPSWPKEELNRRYACEISGLNFNDNCVQIIAKNTSGKVAVLIEPQTKYVQFINNVKPVSSGSIAIGSYRSSELNKITVFGKCRKEAGPFDVAIERPAAFFAFILAEHLADAQISVSGRILEKPVSSDSTKVLVEYSTSIADCLARCNKDSLGLAAESLLKTIAAENNPERKGGSWPKGREIISKYLSEIGIESDQFYIDDASGLSEQNKLSANAIAKVLFDVYKGKNWQLYKDSLAAGGVDGTIAGYFKEKKYKGKIFGKTGYISKVKSFSGVCSTEQGNYIFSIIANNAKGQTRDAINDIAKAIVDSAEM